jgi:hypothetical protein
VAGLHYYLLASLPALGDLGEAPPLSCAAFLARLDEVGRPRRLVETVLLADDLLLRDAFLAGEVAEDEPLEPLVLTAGQVRDELPLPEFLTVPDETEFGQGRKILADAVWGGYFRHAAALAKKEHNAFLAAWVAFEVALRNALAAQRARALNLDPEDYVVAPDLAEAAPENIAAEWTAAGDPLAALRTLDAARWRWLAEHDAWFSFGDDELAVYAARLMLLTRWRRLTEEMKKAKT